MKDVAKLIYSALSYCSQFARSIIVIKYGGSIVETIHDYKEIVLMKKLGLHPVIVHGGSKQITRFMEMLGRKPKFINGLRVTDRETVEISQTVLNGEINKSIAKLINQSGGMAIGMGGMDGNMVIAKKYEDNSGVDLGYVGEIIRINPDIILKMIEREFIPVIATGGMGEDKGTMYNINADTFAAEIAKSLRAEKLIMVTDKDGILHDEHNPSTLIRTMTAIQAKELIADGTIKSGMLPKIKACLSALNGGVQKVHILRGIPNNLLLEIFTSDGVGTEIKLS